ncbi:sensor histidine kinase [Novosphingobium sp. RD2P27]|uniref:histidine kinase n=1 Tax=Novosphingobium kalidii TaxID=3230299 RepID=A0ABV2CZC9_9SPHN
MHFDDRLATVLRQPVSGPVIARIQFRQLIDLLGQESTTAEESPAYAEAHIRLDELAALIPAAQRAQILREPMMRLANPDLVARLAAAEPEVASAAMAAADLSEQEWLALVPSLPVRARGILRHRSKSSPAVEALLERLGIADRGLPPAESATERPSRPELPGRPELIVVEGGASTEPRPKDDSSAGIGALVQRIEAFRKARGTTGGTGAVDTSHLSPEASRISRAAVLALDFTTDSEGRVNWAEGPLAPGLIGYHFAGLHADEETVRLRTAIGERQPLAQMLSLSGGPALAGSWRIDALPRFSQPDGRFIGYAGRLRRAAGGAQPRNDATGEADSMRQILHELRTPANAIQVAAEIIQQQLYGTAPHEYRALAAAIAGDTAQVLAGFDELDRLVKLEAGALPLAEGECDLASLVTETIARLRAWTAPRGSGFAPATTSEALPVAVEQQEAARLVWRLLATLAGATAPGEVLKLSVEYGAGHAVLAVDLPRSLMERMDASPTVAQPFEPVRSLSAGMFGLGFTLRLAVAEAAGAGGSLVRVGSQLELTLPRLTTTAPGHTHA